MENLDLEVRKSKEEFIGNYKLRDEAIKIIKFKEESLTNLEEFKKAVIGLDNG